ncbi:hypothetical protein DXG03_007752 [Asterophora parasitica]|uniref:N-acetyltransferase domain-containing protein n=1 Tax=Asterophora parasitica TaxID=117018 RepID=A0A9P7GD47_9AGAR|nr:hypothetical protein DXG03_007752 [Asterophora parasitica]
MASLAAHSTIPTSKNVIRIRFFRKSDAPQVRELFMLANAHGRASHCLHLQQANLPHDTITRHAAGSPRQVALDTLLFRPISLFAYALILLGFAILVWSPQHKNWGALLSVGVATLFLSYRFLLSDSFIYYCMKALRTDLADIAKHYSMVSSGTSTEELAPSGPSAFWVVECESRDEKGVEIVGAVALDCYEKDGILQGELRRMGVSPHHRRKGIAALLLRALIAHAKDNGIPTVWLGTTEYQQPAMDMYKKYGWVESGKEILKDRLGLGVTKIIMLWFRLDL